MVFGNATIGPKKEVKKGSPILKKKKKQNKGPIVAFSNATIGPGTIPTCGNTPLLVQHTKKKKKKKNVKRRVQS